jgi:hypothetical protein
MAERFHLVVARCTAAIADIEDDLMLQLTASGFEVTEVEDEVAAAAQAEAEEKAARAASRKAEVRVNRFFKPQGDRQIGCLPWFALSTCEDMSAWLNAVLPAVLCCGVVQAGKGGGTWRYWWQIFTILCEACAVIGLCMGAWRLKDKLDITGGAGGMRFRHKPKFN